jgi:hypothetical protein
MLDTAERTLPAEHPLAASLSLQAIAGMTFDAWFVRGSELATELELAVVAVRWSEDSVAALVGSSTGESAYTVQMWVGPDGRPAASCECPVHHKHRVTWCKHRVALALTFLGQVHVTSEVSQLRFATFDTLENLPLERTGTIGSGRVRHLRPGRLTRPQRHSTCGLADGPLEVATSALPLCGRCRTVWSVSREKSRRAS